MVFLSKHLGRIPPARLTGVPPGPYISHVELPSSYCRWDISLGVEPQLPSHLTSANEQESNLPLHLQFRQRGCLARRYIKRPFRF